MGILSRQQPAVDLDGPARAVREASCKPGRQRGRAPLAVAAYFDRSQAAQTPFGPCRLGRVHRPMPQDASASTRPRQRQPGARRASHQRRTARPTAFADLRKRAERVLAQRPGLREPAQPQRAAADVMAQLQAGSPDLLSSLRVRRSARNLRTAIGGTQRSSSAGRSHEFRAGLARRAARPRRCPGRPTRSAPTSSAVAPGSEPPRRNCVTSTTPSSGKYSRSHPQQARASPAGQVGQRQQPFLPRGRDRAGGATARRAYPASPGDRTEAAGP